jgi:hypothetical protein
MREIRKEDRHLYAAAIATEARLPVWQPKWNKQCIIAAIRLRLQEGKPLYRGVRQA